MIVRNYTTVPLLHCVVWKVYVYQRFGTTYGLHLQGTICHNGELYNTGRRKSRLSSSFVFKHRIPNHFVSTLYKQNYLLHTLYVCPQAIYMYMYVCMNVCMCVCVCVYIYTGCHRRKGPNFGRVFLMLIYTDITQNTYIQSWTVTEIMAREVWNFDSCYTLTDCQIHVETGRNMWFL